MPISLIRLIRGQFRERQPIRIICVISSLFMGLEEDFFVIFREKVRKGGNWGGYWLKKIIFAS